jgi:N12 class adenine-specific DNA methylase
MRKTNYDILKYIYNNYWDKKILQMRYFYETSNNFFLHNYKDEKIKLTSFVYHICLSCWN